MTHEKHVMTALFPDRESAELGYWTLAERGYTSDEVSVLMSESAKKRYFQPRGAETALGAKARRESGAAAPRLGDWKIPEERVRQYDQGLRDGGILMLVMPRSDKDAWYFDNMWRIHRAQDVCC